MSSSRCRSKKILLVEDEPGIRGVCLRTLTAEGYRMEVAANGAVAKEILTQEDFDLVLVDIRTPLVNGQQLYRYIEESCPKLVDRVVFTTGDVVNSETQSFLERSGRLYLLKTFTLNELKDTVEKALRRRHRYRRPE
jgi:DNA-binding response OmpR family regulator